MGPTVEDPQINLLPNIESFLQAGFTLSHLEHWDVSEEKLEAHWAGAKWVQGKREGREVRKVRHYEDLGFI